MLVGKNGEEGKEVSNDGREEGKEGNKKKRCPSLTEKRGRDLQHLRMRARIQQQESEVERAKAQKMSRKVKNSFRRWRRSAQHVSLMGEDELQDHALYSLQIKQSREKFKRSVDASAKVLSFFRQERRGLLKISYPFFFCPTTSLHRSPFRCLAPCRGLVERNSPLCSDSARGWNHIEK